MEPSRQIWKSKGTNDSVEASGVRSRAERAVWGSSQVIGGQRTSRKQEMEMGLEGGVAFYLGRTAGSPYGVCQSFLLRVHRLQPHWILKQHALIFVGSPMEGCKTKPDCFLLPVPLYLPF